MSVRFDIVAYKNVGDKFPSVHTGIASNRVKRLVAGLKQLGYGTIVTTEVAVETTRSTLVGGLGGRRG